jgi:hypothetical protein
MVVWNGFYGLFSIIDSQTKQVSVKYQECEYSFLGCRNQWFYNSKFKMIYTIRNTSYTYLHIYTQFLSESFK